MPPRRLDGMPAVARLATLVIAVLVVAGCGWEVPGVQPSQISGPLVTVETRGGECPRGACGGAVAIERSGHAHALTPQAVDLGVVPGALVAAVERAVEATDFEAILARPFTGECPVNFDGQEVIYTFTTVGGPYRIASCEVEIPQRHPLFEAVDAALASVNGRP